MSSCGGEGGGGSIRVGLADGTHDQGARSCCAVAFLVWLHGNWEGSSAGCLCTQAGCVIGQGP